MKYTLNPVCKHRCLLLFITVVLFTACNNNNSKTKQGPEKNDPQVKQKQVIALRQGINPSNAYSDLFLDSARIETFIAQQHIETQKSIAIRSFYNNRAYQFAWFNNNGFTEQALAFRSLYDYSKDSTVTRKSLDNRLDELLNTDSLAPSSTDVAIVSTELLMSWRFINYLDDKLPAEESKTAALTDLVPYKKTTPDNLINANDKRRININPDNAWYNNLQKALQQLVAISKNGGWDTLPVSPKLYSAKTASPLIAKLKKRLQATGQLALNDTTPLYSSTLQAAIRNAQAQFGYTHDTVLTASLLKELNVPVSARINQVLINLERMSWMPEMPANAFILVNIPEYRLHVWQGSEKKFDMNIITGKEGHGTVMFSGDLNQLVFSPYWNLPASIVEKEVLPAIKKNKKYLAEHHMEINGQRNGLPVIRQAPGEWNELGKIKFLFPNSLNIYFHDTPHKWLFSKDQRAYSHGCIRLEAPVKLAAWLLKDNTDWTEPKIDSAMNSDKERYLKLEHPVPVLIYYYTAWVDEQGKLQFRKDIYGHDAALARGLFVSDSRARAGL